MLVKEDSHTLYGFFDQNERHLFRNLISVSDFAEKYNTDPIKLDNEAC